MEDRTCIVPDCAKAKKGSGKYCSMHLSRLARTGSLELAASYPGKPVPLSESFWSKTQKSAGCWFWTGATNDMGYGQIRRGKKIIYTHRLSFEMHVGPIPDGMVIDHICRHPSCVNPEHLRAATQKQNMENLSNTSLRSSSGHRGVVMTSDNKWRPQVMHEGRNYYGGQFENVEEAIAAVTDLRMRLQTHNAEDRLLLEKVRP